MNGYVVKSISGRFVARCIGRQESEETKFTRHLYNARVWRTRKRGLRWCRRNNLEGWVIRAAVCGSPDGKRMMVMHCDHHRYKKVYV